MARKITKMAVERYRASLERGEYSASTVLKYCRDVREFARYAEEESEAAEKEKGSSVITKEAVIAYKRKLQSSGYAARSVNSIIASLNSYFGFAGWEELKVKTIRIQREAFAAEERELTRQEYERLVTAARDGKNERLSLILQTICGTGIRVSELRYITVEASRRGETTVNCKGKTRSIFIVRRLQKKLLAYCKQRGIESGSVFVTKGGKPIDRTNVWREMKSLCRQARVDERKVFPHNLRHLFARMFYGIEKDIAKLADILGHSSINTTRIYIATTSKEHRNKMERLHLIL